MVKINNLDLSKKSAIVAVVDHDLLLESKKAVALGADIIEIRLDLLNQNDLRNIYFLLESLKSQINVPCIATNRLHSDGGKYKGCEKYRIQLLLDVLPVVDVVDIELDSVYDLQQEIIIKAHQMKKKVIVSQHNFNKTPSVEEIKIVLEKCWECGGDIAKFAALANSLDDCLNMLKVTREAYKPACIISMGEIGKHTRVIAPLYGSVLSYGIIEKSVAPGQLNIDFLKKTMEVLI